MVRHRPSFGQYNRRRLSAPLISVLVILFAVMTSASICAFEWLKGAIFRSQIFTLKGVSVSGNNRVSSADIISASGLNVGADGTFSFMSHIVEKRIKGQFRHLKCVDISRDLLGGWVNIAVEERKPSAFVVVVSGKPGFNLLDPSLLREKLFESDYIVIDIDGFVLDKLPARRALPLYHKLPVVAGALAELKIESVSCNLTSPSITCALNVLRHVDSVMPELLDSIHSIDARDPDDIILRLQEGMSIRIAGDRIGEGLLDAKCWISSTRYPSSREGQKSSICYIDVRFPGAVYCVSRREVEECPEKTL